MAKKDNTPLLQEGTIRRMMKLANLEPLGNSFIAEKKYEWHKGDDSKSRPGDHDEGESLGDESDTDPEHRDFMGEQEEELETEDEFELEDEVDPEAPTEDGEVVITDEEAQDIIDLADKLRGAVGDDEVEAEEEEFPSDIEVEEEEEEMVAEVDKTALALQTIQEQLYKRVVARLLQENRRPKTRRRLKKKKK